MSWASWRRRLEAKSGRSKQGQSGRARRRGRFKAKMLNELEGIVGRLAQALNTVANEQHFAAQFVSDLQGDCLHRNMTSLSNRQTISH
jgi:hypothetical protein